MTQIPDAFKGHDLTGWSAEERDGVWYIHRAVSFYNDCYLTILFSFTGRFELHDFSKLSPLKRGTLQCCLDQANKIAEANGGWAPPPIGFSADPGWQPIETAPKNGEAFIGANAQTGRVSECYWSLFSFRIHSYGAPVELTHWRPKFPSPPEAKP